MNFKSLVFSSFVAVSLAAFGVGCASAEPDEETTEATADELNAEDLFCTFFVCEPSGGGSSSRWVKLGEESVDGLFERDRLDVDVNTRFTKLQLRIRDGAVNIHDVEVRFRDGSRFSPDFDRQYGEDTRSEVVTFPSPRRIQSIVIDHSKPIFGTGATVEFWAKR